MIFTKSILTSNQLGIKYHRLKNREGFIKKFQTNSDFYLLLGLHQVQREFS